MSFGKDMPLGIRLFEKKSPKKKRLIIIGGGSAGLSIARRLGDVADILILERSPYRRLPLPYRVPLLIGLVFRNSFTDYICRMTVKVIDRKIPFFESRVLGGASAINGCVHVRGEESLWEKELNRFDLHIKNLSKSYDKIFSSLQVGCEGCILLRPICGGLLDKVFVSILNKNNFKCVDAGLGDTVGYGPVINTVGRIFRSSVLNFPLGKNIQIRLNSEVIGVSGNKEKGFTVQTRNKEFQSDYVVVSAGTIGTNRLFSNGKFLSINHRVQQSLRIGLNVKDHPNVRINVRSIDGCGSLNEIYASATKKFKLIFSYLLGKRNAMQSTGASTALQLDLTGDGQVDLRINLVNYFESGRHGSDGNALSAEPGFALSITPVVIHSSGWITHNSDGKLQVFPNYFSDQRDVELLVKGIQFCLSILDDEELKPWVQAIEDEELLRSDPHTFLMQNSYSGHHLIGGMTDAVTTNFELRNNPGCYVCDASVFENHVSSNIHASVLLMADMFAERLIDQEFGK